VVPLVARTGELTILRILHVIPSVAISDGGPTRAIGVMERALTDLGVEVTTLTSDHDLDGVVQATTGAPGGARRVHARKWTRRYKVAPGMALYLLRHIRSFDAVHIHALFSFSSTIGAWFARALRVPYVIRPLGVLSPYGVRNRRRFLKRWSIAVIEGPNLRSAAAVHFTSAAEMQEAEELNFGLRGVVIPLGVEQEACAAAVDMPLTHAALRGRRIVLFLSRLDPKKNVEALIDACAMNAEISATATLLIAGDGEAAYVDVLKARVQAAGMGDRVVWLGHVEGAAKASVFAKADVFVLPSYSENFGIAAAEALLAGLPCVLTAAVAIAAEAGAAGAAVVTSAEPRALGAAIADILRDEERAKAMGARARAFAADRYSAVAMGRHLVELYGRIRRAPLSVQP
jgi:glycosyltransferase involved in cell wall biosynthesis